MIRATLFGVLTMTLVATGCEKERPALTPASGTRSVVPESQGLSDAQISGVLSTANSNELQQARIALRRAHRKDVRDYARMLIAHHEKASNDANALTARIGLVPEISSETSDLRSSNSELVVLLNDAKRSDFDHEFIGSQIGNHEELLAIIDARLIPGARNGELRELLQALRPVFQSHLERALEIQSKLPQ